MRTIISTLAFAWLVTGCVAGGGSSTSPTDDSANGASRDSRTGLCNDATAPPCKPPRD